jgi:hypothetical protein
MYSEVSRLLPLSELSVHSTSSHEGGGGGGGGRADILDTNKYYSCVPRRTSNRPKCLLAMPSAGRTPRFTSAWRPRNSCARGAYTFCEQKEPPTS